MDELAISAHHEAGHAVEAWCEGIRVESIYVTRQWEGSRCVFFERALHSRSTITSVSKWIIVLLAGGVAARRLAPNYPDWREAYDAREIRKCMTWLRDRYDWGHGERVEYKRQLLARTEERVAMHWPAITALARSLHDRRRMLEPELDTIIRAYAMAYPSAYGRQIAAEMGHRRR